MNLNGTGEKEEEGRKEGKKVRKGGRNERREEGRKKWREEWEVGLRKRDGFGMRDSGNHPILRLT